MTSSEYLFTDGVIMSNGFKASEEFLRYFFPETTTYQEISLTLYLKYESNKDRSNDFKKAMGRIPTYTSISSCIKSYAVQVRFRTRCDLINKHERVNFISNTYDMFNVPNRQRLMDLLKTANLIFNANPKAFEEIKTADDLEIQVE
jgi:hypothetical protein